MAMEMSYAHAWNLLNSTRQTFGAPLITATAGGSRGGGTKLTEFGRMVVKEYRNVERRARGNCNIT
jgi:molybdate transport system regulatory protein